jgi:raffinose/stachyose/melibiose transport system permease protein
MEKMLQNKKTIALFVLPAVLVFGVIIPIPLFAALALGFTKWDLIGSINFIGFNNYIRMFTTDTIFMKSIINTIVYLLLSILMQLPMAYILAIILSQNKRLDKLFRNTLFVPVALSGTAVALMFYFVYHSEIGILNNILRLLGYENFNWAWLAEGKTAMIAVCIKVAWQFVGYHMIIFISGITAISTEILEAAKVDGANTYQIVVKIITPLMKPILKVSMVLITTSSLKSFDSIYVMTGGGPMHTTEVMASWMYTQAFRSLKYGYGAAIGTFLFILCVLLSGFISRVFKSDAEM